MPTYQYLCTDCGGQLEAVQKFTDDPLTVHDECGGKLRKVFSPVGIVFKGSGFYRTDSRDKSSSSSAASSSASSKPDSSKPDSASSSAAESKSSSSDSSSKSSGSSDSSASSSSAAKVA